MFDNFEGIKTIYRLSLVENYQGHVMCDMKGGDASVVVYDGYLCCVVVVCGGVFDVRIEVVCAVSSEGWRDFWENWC